MYTSYLIGPIFPFIIYRYVAFMSGLNFGEENQDCLQLQMFIDLLTGQLGSVQVNTFMQNLFLEDSEELKIPFKIFVP